jgi:hypothetical protein
MAPLPATPLFPVCSCNMSCSIFNPFKYIKCFLCSYLFLTLRIALSRVIVKAMLSVLRSNQTARSFDVPDGTGATPKPIYVPPVVLNVLRLSGSVGPSTCGWIDEVLSMFSTYSTAATPTPSVQSIRESVPPWQHA